MEALKTYVHRGVQTASPGGSASPVDEMVGTSPSRETCASSTRLPLDISTSNHSFQSSPYCSAYNQSLSQDDLNSFGPLSTTTERVYKYQEISRRVPSTRVQSQENQRFISLPETESVYSAKAILESTALRVVSMPERDPRNVSGSGSATHSNSSRSADQGELSLTVDEKSDIDSPQSDRSRRPVSFRPGSHYMPRTPSPPSSPDSVVIIANDNNLPARFLKRGDEVTQRKSSPDSDPEGWITWTDSPPRPIPALHGPPSLPYARCPSGAEGTIIEEQELLPRMIWGLGAGDSAGGARATSSHSPVVEHTAETRTVRKSIPPRFQRLDQSAQSGVDRSHQSREQTFDSEAYGAVPPQEDSHLPDARNTAVIDLADIVKRHRNQLGFANADPLKNTDGTAIYQSSHLLYSPNLHSGLGVSGLQNVRDLTQALSMLDLDPQNIQRAALALSREGGNTSNFHQGSHADSGSGFRQVEDKSDRHQSILKATAPTFVPQTQQAFDVLYQPKSVAGLLSRSTYAHGRQLRPESGNAQGANRLRSSSISSITEQAQSFRPQVQKRSTSLNVYPTPPSSSSPLWSSNFPSPYQDTLLSPDVSITQSIFPLLSPSDININSIPPIALRDAIDVSQLRRTAAYRQLGLGVNPANELGLLDFPSLVASAAPVNHPDIATLSSRQQRVTAYSGPRDMPLVFTDYLQQNKDEVFATGSSPQAISSPPRLRVPPNTPSHVITPRRIQTASAARSQPQSSQRSAGPPPPQKDKASVSRQSQGHPRTQSNLNQQPRSIPFAKLMQRRLSAVPEAEEDFVSEGSEEGEICSFSPRSVPAGTRQIMSAQQTQFRAGISMPRPLAQQQPQRYTGGAGMGKQQVRTLRAPHGPSSSADSAALGLQSNTATPISESGHARRNTALQGEQGRESSAKSGPGPPKGPKRKTYRKKTRSDAPVAK